MGEMAQKGKFPACVQGMLPFIHLSLQNSMLLTGKIELQTVWLGHPTGQWHTEQE